MVRRMNAGLHNSTVYMTAHATNIDAYNIYQHRNRSSFPDMQWGIGKEDQATRKEKEKERKKEKKKKERKKERKKETEKKKKKY